MTDIGNLVAVDGNPLESIDVVLDGVAPIIVNLFEWSASGQYSLKPLAKNGIARTKKGHRPSGGERAIGARQSPPYRRSFAANV